MDATTSAITLESSGKLKIGDSYWLKIASQTGGLTAVNSDAANYAVYAANQDYDKAMTGRYVTELTATVEDVNLFSPLADAMTDISSTGAKFQYTAATAATLSNVESAAYATVVDRDGEAWYITPEGKIHGSCWYLQGTGDVTAEVLATGKAGITFSFDTDGALMLGGKYLVFDTNYKLVDATAAEGKKLYIYTGDEFL
ncbi:MAG: hypothetical protein LUD46_12425 [Parabacteroides sp.]|nr:hypothetical protein [Parabacteroides sp.]